MLGKEIFVEDERIFAAWLVQGVNRATSLVGPVLNVITQNAVILAQRVMP